MEEWQISIIKMSEDVKEMKTDAKADMARFEDWHNQEKALLTDIKGEVNGRNKFMEKIVMLIVVALIVLAGAGDALKYLGG